MSNTEGRRSMGPSIGYALGLVALLVLVWAGWHLGTSIPLHLLLIVAGGLIGWVVGILMTPITAGEQVRFPEYGTALSTFVTGYLVAKLDRLFELSVAGKEDVTESLVGRMLLFASSFALGALFTYVWRAYSKK